MELKIPPLLLTLLLLLLVWLLGLWMPVTLPPLPLQVELALLLALAGVVVCGAAVIHFRRCATTMDPLHPGAESRLVTTGSYGISRNPMYLGFLLVIAAWSLYWAPLLLLLFPPLFVVYMNRFQISVEERRLAAHFGDEYRHYQQRVRRWL